MSEQDLPEQNITLKQRLSEYGARIDEAASKDATWGQALKTAGAVGGVVAATGALALVPEAKVMIKLADAFEASGASVKDTFVTLVEQQVFPGVELDNPESVKSFLELKGAFTPEVKPEEIASLFTKKEMVAAFYLYIGTVLAYTTTVAHKVVNTHELAEQPIKPGFKYSTHVLPGISRLCNFIAEHLPEKRNK